MTMKRKAKLTAKILSVKELTEGKSEGIQMLVGEKIEEVNSHGELSPRFLKAKVLTGPIGEGVDENGFETFWFDGGMKGAFKMGKVQPGMFIEILCTGSKRLEDGNNVNTYDIFELG